MVYCPEAIARVHAAMATSLLNESVQISRSPAAAGEMAKSALAEADPP
jgi:hypothetical protein